MIIFVASRLQSLGIKYGLCKGNNIDVGQKRRPVRLAIAVKNRAYLSEPRQHQAVGQSPENNTLHIPAALGLSRPRCEVHRDGSWHRTAHVWVLSRARREVLLQLRSATKDTFPGCWDVSAAGHVRAGDKSPEAARRELQEELGLSGGELGFLFTVRAVAIGETPMHGPYVDREFQDVYLFAPTLPGNSEKDVSIEDICIQKEEVDEVRYWNVDEYEQAIRLEDPKFVPLGDEYSQLLFEFFKRYFANVENP